MPGETSRPHLTLKSLANIHWKPKKFFSKDEGHGKTDDEKSRLNNDDEIADFLTAGRKVTSTSSNVTQLPQLGRLDISSAIRWPSATELNQKMQEAITAHKSASGAPVGRPRRNKGLHVHFTDREPYVIGEGGENAEDPPMLVARSRQIQDAADDLASEYIALVGNHVPKLTPAEHRARASAAMRAEEGRALTERFSQASNEDEEPSLRGSAEAASSKNGTGSHQRPSLSDGPTPPSTYSSHQASTTSRLQSSTLPGPQPSTTPLHSPSTTPLPQYHVPIHPPVLTPQRSPEAAVLELVDPPHASTRFPGTGATVNTALQSWHLATSKLGDNAVELFSTRVQHLSRVFQLAADSIKPASAASITEWIRVALWWFMKGRAELEKAIRNRKSPVSRDPEYDGLMRELTMLGGNPANIKSSRQSFVDLAKAWWIISDIVPQHPEVARYGKSSIESVLSVARARRDERLSELLELHQSIRNKFGALAMSMKRNNFLPPDRDQPLLAQGLSTAIWVAYPMLTPELCAALSGNVSESLVLQAPSQIQSLGDLMPLGDTTEYFNYGRMFVNVVLRHDRNQTQGVILPCVLSMLRERTDWQVKLVIASQNELVNISVQSDRRLGPTWNNVRWFDEQEALVIRLAANACSLHVVFRDGDFKILSRLYNQAQKLQACLQPEEGEELVFTSTVRSCQYTPADPTSTTFPSEPVVRCRLTLFEKSASRSEGTGIRRLHRGHRMVLVSSPKIKTLSNLNERIGYKQAIEFGLELGDDGLPVLLLKLRNDEKLSRMVFTFHEAGERAQFLSVLQCSFVKQQEMVLANLGLKSLSVEAISQADVFGRSSSDVFKDFSWTQLKVINTDPDDPDFAHSQTMRSENLRICAEAAFGSVTDRVNLGPGQLQIRLDVSSSADVKIYRTPQDDMSIRVASDHLAKDVPNTLNNLLKKIYTSDSVRTFSFHSMADLHKFQAALTGFSVLFDSVVSSFAISRRRMVVPIYKKWEASSTRIQVAQQAKTTQLMVFFEGFSHGHAMNFQLKSTDVYEAFMRSGKHVIRLVDAKFALPKGEDIPSKGFVCPDMPDYPGEHDDIHITLDTKEGTSRSGQPDFKNGFLQKLRDGFSSRRGSGRRLLFKKRK
ncbi:MAG: hypothetical protein M1816_004058 [Peltula sp. TS41687]|nr:MAG: hypothetical protein M1816_004058 [Peltula sp. TS41687]